MGDISLNPLFGGSAFRTGGKVDAGEDPRLNPLFGGSAFRTDRRPYRRRGGLS